MRKVHSSLLAFSSQNASAEPGTWVDRRISPGSCAV